MIAARCGLLLVGALLIVLGFRATAPELSPASLRVVVAAVVGLLAPLLWPGNGASPSRTVGRVVAWSFSATCMTATLLGVLGHPMQPAAKILKTCAMLLPIVLLAHAAAAGLETQWRKASVGASDAREAAGRAAAIVLALLGSLPVWLGPLSELLSGRHGWLIDGILAISPLTHLAVASENDLLRNPWLYEHSNLAALPVSYPEPVQLAWFYTPVCAMLLLVALVFWGPRRAVADTSHTHPSKEKAP